MHLLARLAVILAGSAAGAALGLALASPAHADDSSPVRDILGGVTNTIDTALTPPDGQAKRKPQPDRPRKPNTKPDRPTPPAARPDVTKPVARLVDTTAELVTGLLDRPDRPTEARETPAADTPIVSDTRRGSTDPRSGTPAPAPLGQVDVTVDEQTLRPTNAYAPRLAPPTALPRADLGDRPTAPPDAHPAPHPATVPATHPGDQSCPQLPLLSAPPSGPVPTPPSGTGTATPDGAVEPTGRAPAPDIPPA